MKTIHFSKILLLLGICFFSYTNLNAQQSCEVNPGVEELPLEMSVTASVPNVVAIDGPTYAPKDIIESYSARTDGSVPSNCYYVWVVMPSSGADIRPSNSSTLLVTFRESGNYQISCRVQSTSGEGGPFRYINVSVGN